MRVVGYKLAGRLTTRLNDKLSGTLSHLLSVSYVNRAEKLLKPALRNVLSIGTYEHLSGLKGAYRWHR